MNATTIMVIIVVSILSSTVTTIFLSPASSSASSTNDLLLGYYLTENAVHISPHSLRGKMDSGATDYVLVDLRSQEEYETEHIIGAISIPAYKNRTTSAYDEVDRIVASFLALPPDKDVIVYCYSIPCMTGRKIGKMLAERGIFVKQLGIGWNEWRYFWTLWNHEHEWNITTAEEYVVSGPEPGIATKNNSTACPVAGGGFGC